MGAVISSTRPCGLAATLEGLRVDHRLPPTGGWRTARPAPARWPRATSSPARRTAAGRYWASLSFMDRLRQTMGTAAVLDGPRQVQVRSRRIRTGQGRTGRLTATAKAPLRQVTVPAKQARPSRARHGGAQAGHRTARRAAPPGRAPAGEGADDVGHHPVSLDIIAGMAAVDHHARMGRAEGLHRIQAAGLAAGGRAFGGHEMASNTAAST